MGGRAVDEFREGAADTDGEQEPSLETAGPVITDNNWLHEALELLSFTGSVADFEDDMVVDAEEVELDTELRLDRTEDDLSGSDKGLWSDESPASDKEETESFRRSVYGWAMGPYG